MAEQGKPEGQNAAEQAGSKKPAHMVVADIFSERLKAKSSNQMFNVNDLQMMIIAERIFQESAISPEDCKTLLDRFHQFREEGYGREEEHAHRSIDRIIQSLTPTE